MKNFNFRFFLAVFSLMALVEVEVYDCVDSVEKKRSFPKWALLDLAAIPIVFVRRRSKKTLTPMPPEPVPELMTILLFGTGLDGIGLAARRRWKPSPRII